MIEASWAGVGVAAAIGLVFPAIRGYSNLMSTLVRIEDGQKDFRKEFDLHVKTDETAFDGVRKEGQETRAKLGGLHARMLTVQEKLGIIHHPPAFMIGVADEAEG